MTIQVWDTVGQGLCVGACEGKNNVLFTFGVSNSGKSHTIIGSVTDMGLLPRACNLLQSIPGTTLEGWALEVVSDKSSGVKDLNSGDLSTVKVHSLSGVGQCCPALNMSGATSFSWCAQQGKNLWDTVQDIISRRKTASTQLNAGSSRGHLVLNLTLRRGAGELPPAHELQAHFHALGESEHAAQRIASAFATLKPGSPVGSLTLVDMAGLERFDKAGAAGDTTRQVETCFINGSLLHLTEVFRAMQAKGKGALCPASLANTGSAAPPGVGATPRRKRRSQIPFRNSNLTKLMAPAMSGVVGCGSRVVMLMTAGPGDTDCDEKRSAFKQAQHALGLELDYTKVKPRLSVFQSPRNLKEKQARRGHSAGGAPTPAKTPRLRRTVSTGGTSSKLSAICMQPLGVQSGKAGCSDSAPEGPQLEGDHAPSSPPLQCVESDDETWDQDVGSSRPSLEGCNLDLGPSALVWGQFELLEKPKRFVASAIKQRCMARGTKAVTARSAQDMAVSIAAQIEEQHCEHIKALQAAYTEVKSKLERAVAETKGLNYAKNVLTEELSLVRSQMRTADDEADTADELREDIQQLQMVVSKLRANLAQAHQATGKANDNYESVMKQLQTEKTAGTNREEVLRRTAAESAKLRDDVLVAQNLLSKMKEEAYTRDAQHSMNYAATEAAEADMQAQRDEAVHARGVAEAQRDEVVHARGVAEAQRDEAAHARGVAEAAEADMQAQRDEAVHARGVAEAQRDEAVQACGVAEAAEADMQAQRDEAVQACGVAGAQRDEAVQACGVAEAQRDEAVQACGVAEAQRDEAAHARGVAEAQRDEAVHARGVAEAQRDEAVQACGVAEAQRDEAVHARGVAGAQRDEAVHARGVAEAQRDEAVHARGVAGAQRDEAVVQLQVTTCRLQSANATSVCLSKYLADTLQGRESDYLLMSCDLQDMCCAELHVICDKLAGARTCNNGAEAAIVKKLLKINTRIQEWCAIMKDAAAWRDGLPAALCPTKGNKAV